MERDRSVGRCLWLEPAIADQLRQILTVMVNLEPAAVLWILVAKSVETVRAGGDDFLDVVFVQLGDVLFRQHLEKKFIANAARGIA